MGKVSWDSYHGKDIVGKLLWEGYLRKLS